MGEIKQNQSYTKAPGKLLFFCNLSGQDFFSRISFAFLVLVFLVTAVFCFMLSWQWPNKPFAGFLFNERMVMGNMGQYHWTGSEAGLQWPDKVIEANGRPVSSIKDLDQIIRETRSGIPIVYTILKNEQTLLIPIAPMVFSWADWFVIFLIPFITGLVFLIIGAIVFILKPDTKVSWAFFLSCCFLGLFNVTAFDVQATHYGFKWAFFFANTFFPAAFFHLSLVFPEEKQIVKRLPSLQILPYLLSTTIVIPLEGFYPGPIFLFLQQVARLFAIVSAFAITGSALYVFLKKTSAIGRQRAKVVLFGVALAFPLPALALYLSLFGGTLIKITIQNNFLAIPLIFFPLSIGYAITKHNLFDVDTIIRRTVGYVIVTAVVVGSYVVVSLGLNVSLGAYQIAQSRAFPIVFTLVFILIFNPLRNRIQSIVDRLFFRKEYDAKQIIDRIGAAMTSLLDLPQILKQLVRTFSQDMFIDNSAVLLLNPATASYRVQISEGDNRLRMEDVSFQRSEALPQIIENEKKELTKYDVMEDPKFEKLCLDCAQNFSTLYASLIIPMVLRGEVIGFISLGDKKSGKFYNREDIDLLRTLAGQGAVAIENARMAEQMKNEELVRANLARYLSPQIVDQIIQNDVQVNLGGDRKEVTVLFSDIRNFTSISESMKPEQLVEFLNEYFTEMARIIFANQGSLDKYIGDAIVAVFGSLIPLENSAEPAVKTSVEMMREMVRLNERWKDRYGFNMEMGIGVNTGEVFLGNIGSPERMEFTVIGDTVNTASRFSSLAQGRQVLATRTARDHLGPDFQIRQLPSTIVKGKAEEVEVFEILYD